MENKKDKKMTLTAKEQALIELVVAGNDPAEVMRAARAASAVSDLIDKDANRQLNQKRFEAEKKQKKIEMIGNWCLKGGQILLTAGLSFLLGYKALRAEYGDNILVPRATTSQQNFLQNISTR